GRTSYHQAKNSKDPQHATKSMEPWLKKKVEVFCHGLPSPDFLEDLWIYLMKAAPNRQPRNVVEPQQISQQEWTKIPSVRTQTLLRGHPKRF
uniref:Uncharacterized protein n=1 Tax=Electrophorus electricus TaxID=8005 RepID=A0AAY5EUP6_ELEEL